MLMHLLFLAIGLPLLFYGGDFLVSGSIRISRQLNISPFIIGATVIGFGTSAPELAVSILAALAGAPELAMGNVIGSNIANVGLVLGLTSLLIPLTISRDRLRQEAPALVFATFLIAVLAWDLKLNRFEAVAMVVLLAAYLWRAFNKKEEPLGEVFEEEEIRWLSGKGLAAQWVLVILGLSMLVMGAKLLVDSGVGITRALGVSEWLIGISIIAVGTSLPEIVSSLMAAKRGQGEIAIGNVFGSNIFNILMVLGIAGTVHPLHIREPIHPDLLFTTGLTCLLLVLICLENCLKRRDGIILLTCYLSYMVLKSML
ncbi:MAG: calcium/sodium antiporter [Nitrospinaceae bacterium]|nr:MAG: calcium/sodium antiporter [Nitrospinaceae bacterium]